MEAFKVVVEIPDGELLYLDPRQDRFLSYRLYFELLEDKKRGGPKTTYFPSYSVEELRKSKRPLHFEAFAGVVTFFLGGVPRFRRLGPEKDLEWLAPRGGKLVFQTLLVQYRRRRDRRFVFRRVQLASDDAKSPSLVLFHCLELTEANVESLTLKSEKVSAPLVDRLHFDSVTVVEEERRQYLARVEAVKGEVGYEKARARAIRAARATRAEIQAREEAIAAGLDPDAIAAASRPAIRSRAAISRLPDALAEAELAKIARAERLDKSKSVEPAPKPGAKKSKTKTKATKVKVRAKTKAKAAKAKVKEKVRAAVAGRPTARAAIEHEEGGTAVLKPIPRRPARRRLNRRRVASTLAPTSSTSYIVDPAAEVSDELITRRFDASNDSDDDDEPVTSQVQQALMQLARTPPRKRKRESPTPAPATAPPPVPSMQDRALSVLAGAAEWPVLAIDAGATFKRQRPLTAINVPENNAPLASFSESQGTAAAPLDDDGNDGDDDEAAQRKLMYQGEVIEMLLDDATAPNGFTPASAVFRDQIEARANRNRTSIVTTRFSSQEEKQTFSQLLADADHDTHPTSASPPSSAPSAAIPLSNPLSLESPPPSPTPPTHAPSPPPAAAAAAAATAPAPPAAAAAPAAPPPSAPPAPPRLGRTRSIADARVPIPWPASSSPPQTLGTFGSQLPASLDE